MKFEEAIKIAGKRVHQRGYATRNTRGKIIYKISDKYVVDV